MKFAKLIMITVNNNNKEYIMKQINDSTFTVDYGRVGCNYQHTSYPMYQWDKKYKEKIKKGYKDVSDLVEKVKADDSESGLPYDYITNSSVRNLLNTLYSYTDNYLKENYIIKSTDVSQKQLDEAYQIIEDIKKEVASHHKRSINIDYLNDCLIKLFETIPRRMSDVKSNLFAQNTALDMIDMKLNNEVDMLKTMSDAVELRNKKLKSQKKVDKVVDLTESEQQEKLLNDMGLIVEDVNDDDIELIKKQLGESADLYKKAWRITNPESEHKFNELMKTEPYKDRETKYFWHGSRNQNWYNIIQTGLVTNPKGVTITGKMFGYGIYFAPRAKKSIGYTSLEGSYWASGNSSTGFMALFEVAMGNVLDVYKHEYWCSRTNKDEMWKHNKCNTLYAHKKDGFLYNDEVIAYDDAQVNIKYIVELSK